MAAFRPVDPKQSFPELEERILERWRERDVFHRSLAQRQDAPVWSFYEGPPTANGEPGSHHVLSRVFKDIYPRYRSMRGHRVPRKAGWDCHGLPVELEVERELGISSKAEIEAYGIAEFNERCRESVFRYVEEWNRLTERIGFWIDLDDPYVTLTNSYIESVWWSLRKIWDDGRLYEGHKVVPYCPRCGTALSSHEVAQGYEDVEDPSVYVRLPVREPQAPLQEGDSLLVWTTTPWTLISNAAVAVGPQIEYARVRPADSDEVLVVAAPLVERVLGEGAEVLERMPGSALAGVGYEPPFPYIADYGPRGHTVLEADFVTTEEGTGLVHTAIAFGEDDFRLGEQYGITLQNPVRADGTFDERITDFAGQFVKDADPAIVDALTRLGAPAARRALPPLLSALLALRDAASVLRQVELVRANHRRPRPDAGRERGDRLAPRAHQARPVRQLARGQRRLGALSRALLGHPAADLGVRVRRLRGTLLRRIDGRSARARRPGARRPPPPLHRRGHAALRVLRRRDAPRPGDDRRLVRLGLDAIRPVPLPVRGRGAVHRPLPGRLHQRGGRPDPRLVLLAARGLGAGLRPRELPQLRRPRPDPRPGGPEDVEEPRKRGRSLGGDRPPRRGRLPLVLLHGPAALGRLPLLGRHGGRVGAPVHAHALEHVRVLGAVRERRGTPCGGSRLAGRRRRLGARRGRER